MTLNELIKNYHWIQLKKWIVELYSESIDQLEEYERVFTNLKMLTPEDNQFTIIIRNEWEEDEKCNYTHVYGKENVERDLREDEIFFGYLSSKDIPYSLAFTKWEKWLAMEICPSTLRHFIEQEIICHCLYEMTWSGFDQEDFKKSIGFDK